MSRIVTMAALVLATSTSFAVAGGPAAVAVEPTVIVPAATASSGGLGTVGLIAGVALVALAVGLGNEETATTGTTTNP